ncbi:Uncharacterised protein [Segatella copri]|nr:Uncharacterised protein [Segatella copri]
MRRGEHVFAMLFPTLFYLFVGKTDSFVFVYVHFRIDILFFFVYD